MAAYRAKNQKPQQLNHSQIARSVFAVAESVGISDRQEVERITQEVIARLEKTGIPQPFPGMENLVSMPKRTPPPAADQIEAMVKEILASSKVEPKVSEESDKAMKAPKPYLAPAIPSDGADLQLSANARAVLERRYLQKDAEGKVIETPEQMFHRVAHNIASAELAYNPSADVGAMEEKFYRLMTSLDFLPNSPTLMNAGRELQQLSACFVLPVEDSMESIFDAVKYTALIHKSGGGTGFSFSRLRPEKDWVGSTGGVASGPVSFIRAFDTATDVIKQGGMRRGANMAILNVNHPDIMKFITAKEDPNAFNNFNFSVAVTDEFMKAVESGSDYDLINPRNQQVRGKLNARQVFNKMAEMAHRNGDPGIVFLDRINRDNPTPHLGAIESTNPCGEQPLLPYESCNLGSINLSRMLTSDNGKVVMDYVKLAATVKLAVRFLDNVIDLNHFPLPKIEEMTRQTRKTGLGVMGFADMLLKLGKPYNSEEALKVAQDIMKFLDEKATEASVELAGERGIFPAFRGSIYDAPGKPRVRNATRTTIAPTGSLSIIAGCSSGIEPLFALSFIRTILDNEQFLEVNPVFDEVAKRDGFHSQQLMDEIARKGSIQGIEGVPGWAKRLFVTALDISPEWHVKMQAAFQKHTNNAVSKTVTFPSEATVEDVAKVYMMAYREGCKGITIYRDRSREQQVLSTRQEQKEPVIAMLTPRRRPRLTMGKTHRVATGCGNIYVTVNQDEEGLCEVFSTLGKAGGCASAQLEAICRLISLALRSGLEPSYIVKHLRGIRCPSIAWEEGHAVLSCPDAVGGVLEGYLEDSDSQQPAAKTAPKIEAPPKNVAGQCPECSGLLIYQEGCLVCPFCGYTKCG